MEEELLWLLQQIGLKSCCYVADGHDDQEIL
jgi:hypothetical protein